VKAVTEEKYVAENRTVPDWSEQFLFEVGKKYQSAEAYRRQYSDRKK